MSCALSAGLTTFVVVVVQVAPDGVPKPSVMVFAGPASGSPDVPSTRLASVTPIWLCADTPNVSTAVPFGAIEPAVNCVVDVKPLVGTVGEPQAAASPIVTAAAAAQIGRRAMAIDC